MSSSRSVGRLYAPKAGQARPPILGAAVATAVVLAMLVALGVWQLHRRQWKLALLQQIDAAALAPPIPLASATPPPFAKVVSQGTLRAPPVALYGVEVRNERLGAMLVELLDRPGLKPLVVVLGWVPTDAGLPRAVTGPATITGYVRAGDTPTWLSAADDVPGRRFFTLEPAAIAATLGATDAAPFALVALGKLPEAGLPVPAEALPVPVNNHLQYALTWFGLAGALLAIFVSWVRRNRL